MELCRYLSNLKMVGYNFTYQVISEKEAHQRMNHQLWKTTKFTFINQTKLKNNIFEILSY